MAPEYSGRGRATDSNPPKESPSAVDLLRVQVASHAAERPPTAGGAPVAARRPVPGVPETPAYFAERFQCSMPLEFKVQPAAAVVGEAKPIALKHLVQVEARGLLADCGNFSEGFRHFGWIACAGTGITDRENL